MTPAMRVRHVVTSGPAIAFAALAVVWELGAQVFDVTFLPSVGAVLGRTVDMLADADVRSDIFASLRNLGMGFGIAAVIGLALGLLMGQVRFARYALEPYVNAMLMAPQLVFAPILFIVYGLSNAAIVTLIVLYTTFIIVVNTMAGLHAVDRSLVEMARTYGASRFQLVRRVHVPSAMPMIMTGLRLGIGRAVKGMINGEMFIAFVGLGARAVNLGGRFDSEGVVAIVLIVAVISLVSSSVVQAVDRRVTRWAHPAGR